MPLPRIKKTITSFLTEEEGKITKKSLLVAGAFMLGTAGLSKAASASHNQNIAHTDSSSINYVSGEIQATHSHYDPAHSSHASHGSHGSHSSHSSHSSHTSHTSHSSHSSHTSHTSHSSHSSHGSHCSTHCSKFPCQEI